MNNFLLICIVIVILVIMYFVNKKYNRTFSRFTKKIFPINPIVSKVFSNPKYPNSKYPKAPRLTKASNKSLDPGAKKFSTLHLKLQNLSNDSPFGLRMDVSDLVPIRILDRSILLPGNKLSGSYMLFINWPGKAIQRDDSPVKIAFPRWDNTNITEISTTYNTSMWKNCIMIFQFKIDDDSKDSIIKFKDDIDDLSDPNILEREIKSGDITLTLPEPEFVYGFNYTPPDLFLVNINDMKDINDASMPKMSHFTFSNMTNEKPLNNPVPVFNQYNLVIDPVENTITIPYNYVETELQYLNPFEGPFMFLFVWDGDDEIPLKTPGIKFDGAGGMRLFDNNTASHIDNSLIGNTDVNSTTGKKLIYSGIYNCGASPNNLTPEIKIQFDTTGSVPTKSGSLYILELGNIISLSIYTSYSNG